MKNQILTIIATYLLISCSCKQHTRASKVESGTDSGKVIGIIDGDTYDLLLKGNRTIRVRMHGIDAPEKGMPYYKVAKTYLGELCFNKYVRLVQTDVDRNKRIVGKTYLNDGRELGAEMIKAGYAWHYKKYSTDTMLANLENKARSHKIGLWADQNSIAPWEIRKMHREGISTKDSFK